MGRCGVEEEDVIGEGLGRGYMYLTELHDI